MDYDLALVKLVRETFYLPLLVCRDIVIQANSDKEKSFILARVWARNNVTKVTVMDLDRY